MTKWAKGKIGLTGSHQCAHNQCSWKQPWVSVLALLCYLESIAAPLWISLLLLYREGVTVSDF